MHYPFYLLALLPLWAQAGKEAPVTKTFKFTEDFFLEFYPLPTAVNPDNVDVLMSALDDYAEDFKQVWIEKIEDELQGGDRCTVDLMRVPKFSMCDWKYPDRYDVEELPTPGQCYNHENGFVQRIYYKIDELVITCPEKFSYKDLDKDAYTESAFSKPEFLNLLNPPNDGCDGDKFACAFASANEATYSEGYDQCNAELFINRFTEVPVYLKCLNQGFGPKTANRIIKALDKYFELVVFQVLEEQIYEEMPEGFVYKFVSPYESDRKYCSHGSFYTEGNLVNQAPDADGIYITKFIVGFDVIIYKPKEYEKELLPNVDTLITEAFNTGDFLIFLQDEFPNGDFIQDDEKCDAIDPGQAEITFSPTEEPTSKPTEGPECDLDSDDGCADGQVCRLSCVWGQSEPQCYDDDEERDCREKYGPGWICRDTDMDGIITAADNSDGCQYLQPTMSPSEFPTSSPVVPIITTTVPTISPSLRPTTLEPTVTQVPTEFIWPSASPSQTSKPSSAPTDLPSTSQPTLSPTYGVSDTVDKETTVVPTPVQIRPVLTLIPTTSPTETDPALTTPKPTCRQCIVHPDDTDEDECPIVTTGTCGNGNRGDGICPYAGHCCSEWGWCGTTPEHCESAPAPTPSNADPGAPAAPTYSVDAGQCALGEVGDGFCPGESLCCSDWGYCGEGEQYCFTTRIWEENTIGENEDDDGTCGGGGVGDGKCRDGLCCSIYGFCGEGELYCTGQLGLVATDAEVEVADDTIKNLPANLPTDLTPEFGFRCGFSEVDARSNCKPQCTHHVQCSDGEECWGVQLNYCNTFEEGSHPVCTDLDLADNDSRCGYDETSARGHCGPKCQADNECPSGEFCFPTLLNLCECHEETCPEEAEIAFASAKALISPYYVEKEPQGGDVQGKPRNASCKLNASITAAFMLVLASVNAFL